jgi:hypothetical protein
MDGFCCRPPVRRAELSCRIDGWVDEDNTQLFQMCDQHYAQHCDRHTFMRASLVYLAQIIPCKSKVRGVNFAPLSVLSAAKKRGEEAPVCQLAIALSNNR